MMRVGLDCQALGSGLRQGFSSYLGNLLRTLKTRYPEHQFVNWTCNHGPGWRLPNQFWWDQVQIPWSAFNAKVDVIHTPAFSGPVLRHSPLVITVMDLLYTRHPEWLPTQRARWYWGRWIPFTARRATAVIAPSEATKRDLVSLAGIPPERITVIPLAVDKHFLTVPTEDQVQAYRVRQGLDGPYILYVGSIDHRKDLLGLIRAYAKARTCLKTLRLVIAGHLLRGQASLLEEIRASNLTEDVLLPGHVPDQELLLLYAGARAFVYPSWWEGFGLPPLEAMAMGVPVITYRSSSLPEVVGDGAILIDPPFTVDALESAMIQVLLDESTRADLIARGQRRVKAFSWEKTAEQTLSVYERCRARSRQSVGVQ